MEDQARITDFFQPAKKGSGPRLGQQAKRKQLSPTLATVRPVFRRKLTEPEPMAPREDIHSALQTRGKLLLDLAKSPIKSPIKATSAAEARAIVASPAKRRLTLSEALKSPTKAAPERSSAERTQAGSLRLPTKYKNYVDLFWWMDHVVSLLFNRGEACTFAKVKHGIQDKTKKTFTMDTLAQLKTIYPESYNLQYQKQATLQSTTKLEFTLVLTPIIEGNRMTLPMQMQRKRTIEKKLLDIAKEHHQKFLQSLDPPIQVDNSLIFRWHKLFEIEAVPDIKSNADALPKAPIKVDLSTALSALIKASVQAKAAKEAELNQKITDQITQAEKSPVKITSGPLKGLSGAFLEKIRAKAAHKAAQEMTRSPAVEREISIIKRLPDVIRIINNYFISERKGALLIEDIVVKVCHSYYTSVSAPDVQEWIEVLTKKLPDWICKHNLKKGVFVKINRSKPIDELIKRLNAEALRLKGSA